ncbi:MAG: ABC transporter permease [Lentisphaeria bacterium]|nr:ABC transporter permease [Lentisphaeria bacterium]
MRRVVSHLMLVAQCIALALRQVAANKTRSLLTTLGIIIGVASVTSVVAALTGLKRKVLGDLESFGTNKLYAWPVRPDSGPHRRTPHWHLRFQAESFEGLLSHCPSVASYTLVSGGGRETVRAGQKAVENVRIQGIQPDWHRIENRPVLDGRELSVVDSDQAWPVCLINPDLRDKLGFPRDCIGETLLLEGRRFRVVGVVSPMPQMSMIGELIGSEDFELFVPLTTHMRMRPRWLHLMVASRGTSLSDEAQAELRFFMRRARGLLPGEPDTFKITNIQSEVKKFNDLSRLITFVAGGIVCVSLLVGGIGIMNIMLVSVSERTREIGLRKAVGATRAAILTQFLVEALILCLLGGVAGIACGQGLSYAISAATPLMDHTSVPFWATAMSLGFSIAVGICFGMFPAIKAANLDPIEALRHE